MTDELDDLDPDLEAALVRIGKRERARKRELCPRCSRGEVTRGSFCSPCNREVETMKRRAELDRKRHWWSKHGKDWRAEREAES